jgi:hypothetical protein
MRRIHWQICSIPERFLLDAVILAACRAVAVSHCASVARLYANEMALSSSPPFT